MFKSANLFRFHLLTSNHFQGPLLVVGEKELFQRFHASLYSFHTNDLHSHLKGQVLTTTSQNMRAEIRLRGIMLG